MEHSNDLPPACKGVPPKGESPGAFLLPHHINPLIQARMHETTAALRSISAPVGIRESFHHPGFYSCRPSKTWQLRCKLPCLRGCRIIEGLKTRRFGSEVWAESGPRPVLSLGVPADDVTSTPFTTRLELGVLARSPLISASWPHLVERASSRRLLR